MVTFDDLRDGRLDGISRRGFVGLGLGTLVTAVLSSCGGAGASDEGGSGSGSTVLEPAAQDEKDASESGSSSQAEGKVGDKTLVLYFSQTGNTESIAKFICQILGGADGFHLQTKEPYVEADLSADDDSRCRREQDNAQSRPELAGDLPDLSQYGTVFVGFPIWFDRAPRALYTYVEGAGLAGRKVYAFCTSAVAGIDDAVAELAALDTRVEWLKAMRFEEYDTYDAVSEWIDQINNR